MSSHPMPPRVPRWALGLLLSACGDPNGLTEDETIPESWYCRQAREWNPDWDAWERQVVVLVNARRGEGAACAGVAYPPAEPLEVDDKLRCAARKHALDMRHNGFVSHQSADGSLPDDRMRRAGYVARSSGENVAVIGYPLVPLPGPAEAVLDAAHIRHLPSPNRVVDLWMQSPPHCENIMNRRFTDTGVGYVLATDGAPIFTQSFARR